MGFPWFVRSMLVVIAVSVAASETFAQAVPEDFVITLERDYCGGGCPVYTVSIDAKGNVVYDGKDFVRVEGRQADRIDGPLVAALVATAERIGFFALRDQYRFIRNPDGTETIVTDLPTAFVSVTRERRSKRVEDYFGGPPGLKELAQQIDDAARTKRWIRLDEPMLRQLAREGWAPSVEERAELLWKALQHDEVDVVKGLLEIGADPNAAYYGTNTPPLMVVRSAAAARALLEAGADPFIQNAYGGTALGWSVHLAPDVTEVLLKQGVQVDQPFDSDGRTPLWQAACVGNVGAVTLLLSAGADPALRPASLSSVECARVGRENARWRRLSVLNSNPLYVEDFDGVIALLEQALKRKRP